ncbi:Reversal of tor2 lethality [Exophiala xenobiotica]|nr:Reversal of tor2 lethality [Exophiala xenobiotica]KAK5274779.1 Reversal of tor2 lethality [Exophiala xenobiotica]KAK5293869.1 Reversal of tor2 lethality [Exophiala xenobiotica]KAK5496922.1 Reversal of tor2 lethality [Exophiala xenobiotica]KAK5541697.1 Reversal of tor2 lethality [Chaetothyriales sp. CCFEE 6169]
MQAELESGANAVKFVGAAPQPPRQRTEIRAQYDAKLVGTWTTKSKKVMTGPGFYNPVSDTLIEPELAGISYSFTSDGYYEEAYYRAISNPTTPHCPSAIMQWQHGTYSLPGNGSLILTPIGVDGRQLTSSPCSYDNAIYIRYEQAELMKSYEILTDPFHNVPRLNLYKFDGSPIQPMYLAASPPQMLPTQTLNPTSVASATGKARVKRTDGGDGDSDQERLRPLNKNNVKTKVSTKEPYNPDHWWWAGVGLTALGTVMYMMPTSI